MKFICPLVAVPLLCIDQGLPCELLKVPDAYSFSNRTAYVFPDEKKKAINEKNSTSKDYISEKVVSEYRHL